MPRQINGVAVSLTPDGQTANIQIGGNGYQAAVSDIFDRSTEDQSMIKTNVRLAYLIGNFTQLDTTEFLLAVNKGTPGGQQAGLQGKIKAYFIGAITLLQAGSVPDNDLYNVQYGPTEGSTMFGFQVYRSDLANDVQDPSVIVKNLNPFLRIAAWPTLSSGAIAAIGSRAFWY